MKDNPPDRLDALFAAARAVVPETERAEFGFETRLAARLRAETGLSLFAWAWRLCPLFAALALAVGWWQHTSLRAEADAQIVAEAAHSDDDEHLLVACLTGEGR